MSKLTRSFYIAFIAALTGCLLLTSTLGERLEENLGEIFLYKLRGTVSPPPDVAMVYIDGNTATQLGLSEELKKWPRSVHACILKKLKAAGASVVVFDIAFLEPEVTMTHPEEICSEIPAGNHADDAFVDAVKDFGNVILLEKLEQVNYRTPDQTLSTSQSIKPFEKLAEAAVATGPFVLPDETLRLATFWAYLCDQQLLNRVGGCANKIATLPMLALQHSEVENKPIDLQLNKSTDSMRLNFYGPPRTIPCRSYQSILDPMLRDEACGDVDFSGKVVFIGIAEYDRPAQTDSYYTVFSGNDGIDLVGVEVMATAFANLLTETTLNKPNTIYSLLIIVLVAIILGILVSFFSLLTALGIGSVIFITYLAIAYVAFTKYYLILPVMTPILIQSTVAIIIASFIHYRYEKIRREALQQITGYYISENETDQSTYVLPPTGLVYGVCMATDMENSTVLVEMLGPSRFAELMDLYYSELALIIKKHDGILLDIAGDGTMSAWLFNKEEFPNVQTKACNAALEIIAVQEHLTVSLNSPIQTRIGLHAGEFTLNFVRIGMRYFYKGTGNTLHIASRIEQLNKKLNTKILLSESIEKSVDKIALQPHGLFTIKGLSKKVKIFEMSETK